MQRGARTVKKQKTKPYGFRLIEQIDAAIANQDVSFSSFVIQACEYALENMDTDKNE